MCLYIDIINLFIEMIKIVAASLNENVDDKDNKDDGFELLLGLKKNIVMKKMKKIIKRVKKKIVK